MASDDATPAQRLTQFGAMCYTLHHLVEQATPNLDYDYHPHKTIAANSELLRKLACLAFQIEPCFSEPEELEALTGSLMTQRLPPSRRSISKTDRRKTTFHRIAVQSLVS